MTAKILYPFILNVNTLFYFFILKYSFAAFIKALKIGAGRSGLDLNSGWNCPAIKNGWFLYSTISTKLPSGDVPDAIRPAASRHAL